MERCCGQRNMWKVVYEDSCWRFLAGRCSTVREPVKVDSNQIETLRTIHLIHTGDSWHTQTIQINKVVSENEKCPLFYGKKLNRLFGLPSIFSLLKLPLSFSYSAPKFVAHLYNQFWTFYQADCFSPFHLDRFLEFHLEHISWSLHLDCFLSMYRVDRVCLLLLKEWPYVMVSCEAQWAVPPVTRAGCSRASPYGLCAPWLLQAQQSGDWLSGRLAVRTGCKYSPLAVVQGQEWEVVRVLCIFRIVIYQMWLAIFSSIL